MRLKCINQSFNSCQLTTRSTTEHFTVPEDDIRFNQFVVDKYTYTTRKDEEKEAKRTVRQSFRETFSDFKQNFDELRDKYLLHRYGVKNDQFHWPQIKEDATLGYVFHQDFFENTSCSPRFEPQDAHFAAKQASLHCRV